MAKVIGLLAALAVGCVTACGSQHAAAPATPATSSAKPATPAASAAPNTKPSAPSPATSATTSAPDCVGLSICPTPPPDAEGNPACFYSDGWQSSGAGIEVWYFNEPQHINTAGKVTAVVRKKDGTTESQDANIEAGQQVHRFEFATIDKSTVAEVLFETSSGHCFVIGPGS